MYKFSILLVAGNIQQKPFLDSIKSYALVAATDLYIAAVEGNKPLEVVMLNRAETGSDHVEMDVPARDGITIVVLYHWTSTGSLYYYGNTILNLEAGKVTSVSIDITATLEDQLQFLNVQGKSFTWTAIPGASAYLLERDTTGNGP